jgi:hypothetical protein
MPSPASNVGPQQYPFPPGALDSAIGDPVLEGIASYVMTWLATDLNPKFANLNGSAPVAVLPSSVFYYDPFKRPSAFFVRGLQDGTSVSGITTWAQGITVTAGQYVLVGAAPVGNAPDTRIVVLYTQGGVTAATGSGPVAPQLGIDANAQADGSAICGYLGPASNGIPKLPALFVWRESGKMDNWSTVQDLRTSVVKVAYVANQILVPGAWEDRYGFFPAVEGVLMRSFSIGHHPQHQADQSIAVLLKLAGLGIVVGPSKFELVGPIPGATGADQPGARGFPAVTLSMTIYEEIGLPTATEQPGDLQVGINVVDDGDPRGPLNVLDRVFPAAPLEEDT